MAAKTGFKLLWYGDGIFKEISVSTPDGLFAGGQLLVDTAASKIHDRTGVLRESGYVATEEKTTYRQHKLHNKQAKIPKGGAVAGFAAFYAKFIEFGTVKLSARPYLRPAFDELKEQIAGVITVKIGTNLKGRGRRLK